MEAVKTDRILIALDDDPITLKEGNFKETIVNLQPPCMPI
jgi:hypothetical protein